jgi:hypothetical protein
MALALLVEADGRTMSINALAAATRLLWVLEHARAAGLEQALREEGSRRARLEADEKAHMALMNLKSARTRKGVAATRDERLRTSALDHFRRNPGCSVEEMARMLYKSARAHQWSGFGRLTIRGIRRIIKGTKKAALESLAAS